MSFHVSLCMLFNSMYAIACMMVFKRNVSVISNILGGEGGHHITNYNLFCNIRT